MKARNCLRFLFASSLLVFGAARSDAAALAPSEQNSEVGTQEAAKPTANGIEINDKFILTSRKNGNTNRLDFIILDGIRKSYPGDCRSPGPVPGIGVPRETRLIFEYEQANSGGEIIFSISRTLDFSGNIRKYQLGIKKGELLALDIGVLVSLDSNSMMSYKQVAQPIGPAGRRAVSLRFDAMGEALSSAVVDLEADRWSLEPDGKANGLVISSARVAESGAYDIAPVRNERFDSPVEVNLRNMLASAKKSANVSTVDLATIYCFPSRCVVTFSFDTCKRDILPFCSCLKLNPIPPYGWTGVCDGSY